MNKLRSLTNEELGLLIKKNSRGKSTMMLELLSYEVLRRCIFESEPKNDNLPVKVENE